MKRPLTLTALLVVAMLCVPAAEISAQEGANDEENIYVWVVPLK